jgi:uncharacterized protein (DUF1697 family)
MPKYVAFLRAINVGGHTVKMAHLKELFESLDLSNVETFIASGNVVFDSRSNSKSLERKIEKHLHAELGYEVSTFVRTIQELNRIVAHPAFSEPEITAKGNILYVSFTEPAPTKQTIGKLLSLADEVNSFHVNDREIYWLRRSSLATRGFVQPPIEKVLGGPVTVRNVTTVRKLAAKYS